MAVRIGTGSAAAELKKVMVGTGSAAVPAKKVMLGTGSAAVQVWSDSTPMGAYQSTAVTLTKNGWKRLASLTPLPAYPDTVITGGNALMVPPGLYKITAKMTIDDNDNSQLRFLVGAAVVYTSPVSSSSETIAATWTGEISAAGVGIEAFCNYEDNTVAGANNTYITVDPA